MQYFGEGGVWANCLERKIENDREVAIYENFYQMIIVEISEIEFRKSFDTF